MPQYITNIEPTTFVRASITDSKWLLEKNTRLSNTPYKNCRRSKETWLMSSKWGGLCGHNRRSGFAYINPFGTSFFRKYCYIGNNAFGIKTIPNNLISEITPFGKQDSEIPSGTL
ncbi:hypothetical protein ANN_00745 [Periplaneta americana]|uniref:Uncharacterized protein n=1 Tax=Periplaneta americana TaxID=6978 RepID=A0ABQ8TTF3_PERAM|nr:hypothetical protein ANN_00745 [Periplaneta americana]